MSVRILHVLTSVAVDSGVSSIVVNLSHNTERCKFDFMVLKEAEISYADMLQQNGSLVYCVGNVLSPKTFFASLKNIEAFFKEYGSQYDVVHLHSPTIHLFTLRYAKKYGIPCRIIHSHSSMTSVNFLKKTINKVLLQGITKYANEYFACSSEAAHFLYGKEFCDTHRVELIYNAVECSKFLYKREIAKSMREKLGILDDIVFVHASNYSPIKNHMFLVDVIERFKESEKKVKFLFVGDGPTRKMFEDEIKVRGLQNLCIFIDKTADVVQYLYAADAAILPSLKEGLPVVLVEAQAAGLPFFTSDTVTREVQIGQGEFLPLNTEDWFNRLSVFNALSDKERMEHSETFQNSVFNLTHETERVAALYEKLVKDKYKSNG